MNKTTRILATLAASFSVFGALSVATPARADDMETRYRAGWIWRNLDTREVARFHTMGFSDGEIKAAANLAMRTGLDTDYILRLSREGNQPITEQAARWNVNTADLNNDIPGYGLDPAMPATTPMPSTTTTSSSSKTTSSSTTTTISPATTTTPPPTNPTLPATPPPATPPATPPAEPATPPATPPANPAEPSNPTTPTTPPAHELAPL